MGDAQVLDEMLDEKAGGKVPGDHLGAVVGHLPGTGGAGGDGGQQLLQVQPGGLAIADGLGHPRHRPRDGDLVGHLGVLAGAVRALVDDVAAHFLEQGQGSLKVRRRAAHHDGQRAGPGARIAAGHRRVKGP